MATFNVDSLEFEDDEEVRVGADGDYGFSYDSGNDALEIEDRVNSAIASIPRGTSTDLVGGKFAETVSEGKALADDGNVYDSIQDAVDAASSWVKVGPGTFSEDIRVVTSGMTVGGSGDRTVITGGVSGFRLEGDSVTIKDLKITNKSNDGIRTASGGANATIINVTVVNALRSISPFDDEAGGVARDGFSVLFCKSLNAAANGIHGTDIIYGCTVEDAEKVGIIASNTGDNVIIAANNIRNTDGGIQLNVSNNVVYGNIVRDANNGIEVKSGADNNIVAKNRLIDTDGIEDDGTGTLLDNNLETE